MAMPLLTISKRLESSQFHWIILEALIFYPYRPLEFTLSLFLQEDKKAETEKAKQTKKMDIDKKVEEVESASGEKVVRAAHVPVPSQVSY